ncbi:multidrug effflux MFS transporter [Amorphus orientalis]|uniref:Bcr/CflA family efflux transporter n=1 Tax=Amorphus orientalis TaxID=649198 RepID=A0AAE3VQ91_9HYPH|nr:multidrug effflux MFS transporter [Amorphus orientalis]MDQ0316175.1 DHA1 family bicyclomycin/chloramphenicol resistance-like MFS transporter [Amorphus orientalis]
MSFVEFIALNALMMALTALSVDIMLPALPDIGDSFGVTEENHRQLLVGVYMLGFALGQVIYGPLSDRFGRKPILYVGLLIYLVGTGICMLAPEFGHLLLGRLVQGIGCGGPRVIAIALVRDKFEGRAMGKVMSFIMMIFIVVPVIAPSVGGAITAFGPWIWMFYFLFFVGLVLLIWTGIRLPETCPPENRTVLSPAGIAKAFKAVVTTRQSVGYAVSLGFMFGVLIGYVSSAQQVYQQVYGLGAIFPVFFGAVAIFMSASSLTNSQLVERMGMRRLSHGALIAMTVILVGAMLLDEIAPLSLATFTCAFGGVFFCVGLILPNFNALAMEPLGRVAGMGSSLIGAYMTGVGAILGTFVGQHFDGSIQPMTRWFAAFAVCSLVAVLITERGRLFGVGEGR